jgi:hypothetical protein
MLLLCIRWFFFAPIVVGILSVHFYSLFSHLLFRPFSPSTVMSWLEPSGPVGLAFSLYLNESAIAVFKKNIRRITIGTAKQKCKEKNCAHHSVTPFIYICHFINQNLFSNNCTNFSLRSVSLIFISLLPIFCVAHLFHFLISMPIVRMAIKSEWHIHSA